MKKRIIAVILSAVLALTGLTACNDSTVQSSIPNNTTTASSTTKAPETTTTTTKAETSATTTKAETSATTSAATEATTTTTTEATTPVPETQATTTTTTKAETPAPETEEKPSVNPAPTGANIEFAKNLMPGWNLGNSLEACSNKIPTETVWGNPTVTKDIFVAVKKAGFNSVRIPVSYLDTIDKNNVIDSKRLDRVQEVVDMAIDSGLYAIINIHGDGYYSVDGGWLLCAESDADQVKIREKLDAVWTQIATRFKDYDEHLIFESMNEVFDGDYDPPEPEFYKNINNYNQVFVDAVRGAGGKNKTRYLLVPGWNTDIDATTSGSDFVYPDDSAKRTMVSVHYYAPYEFCLKESAKGIFRWGKGVTTQAVKHMKEDYVDAQFDKLYNDFISKDIPVIIGEYGAIDKSWNDERNTVYRAYYCEYVNYAATKRGIVTVYWDNGYNGKNGHAIFDRKTCKVTEPEIIAAIMRGVTKNSAPEAPTV